MSRKKDRGPKIDQYNLAIFLKEKGLFSAKDIIAEYHIKPTNAYLLIGRLLRSNKIKYARSVNNGVGSPIKYYTTT